MKCQNPGGRIEVLLKVISLYNFIIGSYLDCKTFFYNKLNFSSLFALFFGAFTEISTFVPIQDGGSKMADPRCWLFHCI